MKTELLKKIYLAAVRASTPYSAVKNQAEGILAKYRSGGFTRLFVVGMGKGACSMGRAVEETLGGMIETGLLVAKYGHTDAPPLRKLRVIESAHPVPDKMSETAAAEILALLENADEKTLILLLISGGGSALISSPWEGLTLADKQRTTELLLKSGTDIAGMNAVRKHLSRIKGGRLAAAAHPAAIISLIISDVLGNRLDTISSGPAAPDETTFAQALEVLAKYGLRHRVPSSVLEHLTRGAKGELPETPKSGDPVFDRVENRIIADNAAALAAARDAAAAMGIPAVITSANVQGDARDEAKRLAREAVEKQKDSRGTVCLISGGETTLKVTGSGTGGRNMEMALVFAIETEGHRGISFLSAGTDGTDGPTPAAGAIVDGTTAAEARKRGINPEEFLKNNDSFSFFSRAGGLVVTGPTGTNVMDMQLTLVSGDE